MIFRQGSKYQIRISVSLEDRGGATDEHLSELLLCLINDKLTDQYDILRLEYTDILSELNAIVDRHLSKYLTGDEKPYNVDFFFEGNCITFYLDYGDIVGDDT